MQYLGEPHEYEEKWTSKNTPQFIDTNSLAKPACSNL